VRTDPTTVDPGVSYLGVVEGGPGPDSNRPTGPPPPPAPPGWPGATDPPAGRSDLLVRGDDGAGPARGWVRWSQAAILTLAMLVGLAAAAIPGASLRFAYLLPVAQRSAMALTDDTLYVVTGTPASATVEDPLWWLHAYRLDDGAPRWRVLHNVSARHNVVSVTVVDGLPVVTGWRTYTAPMSRPPIDLDGFTTAYDPATDRWRRVIRSGSRCVSKK
jgi:hypothetical protein